MRRIGSGMIALAALALVTGCSSKEEAREAPAKPASLHKVMANEIDLRADDVWAIGNAAMNDIAGIDPSKMTDTDWANLAKHASSLQQAALDLAHLDPLIVVEPGGKIADEDKSFGDSSADVQANIDKNPDGLRAMALTLADHSAEIAKAATAHDAAKAGPLINELDGVCENCHLEYWYPSQKEIIEKLRNGEMLDSSDFDTNDIPAPTS